MIRLTVPSIDEADIEAVADVLRSGFLVQGPRVLAFESVVAKKTGADHAVAVTNCTAALHLALLAAGVGPGDRVAVPAYSWPATINVVPLCGAQPILVDIDPATFNMDVERLAGAIHRHGRLKAIIPVHTFGNMADMAAICTLADHHDAVVIEDAACALGATLDGRSAGTWGRLGCYSFHPRKAVTTGEGGVIVTSDLALARGLKALRNHGLDPDSATPDFIMAGYNTRMTEFQAALGSLQVGKLDRILQARRAAAGRYDALLQRRGIVQRQTTQPDSYHTFQSYVVLLPREAAPIRDTIIREMREVGIETTIGTYALPFIRYIRERYGYAPEDFPVVADIAARALSLPLSEVITLEEQQLVVDCLEQLLSDLPS